MDAFLGVVIGAGIGCGLGYFGKCASGLCPLTSNPLMSAALGACIGFLFTAAR